MAFVVSMPRIALGSVYALLFGVLISYQLQIGTKVRSQKSNASVLQEKTSRSAEEVAFYDTFYDRCGMTLIFSCIAFLCFIVFSFKTTQLDFVTAMTQIAVVLGTFIFFFSIKLLSYAKQSDLRYGTNLKKSAIVNLSLTGAILALSIGLVLRYGNVKEWNVLKIILNPGIVLEKLKTKFVRK